MPLQPSADGEKRVIWFGPENPWCAVPLSLSLSLGTDDSAEAFVNRIGDVFGDDLGPKARTLLTHVFRTVQAANSPEERTTLRQAYSFLVDEQVRAPLVAQAAGSGRLPAATSDFWNRQGEAVFPA